MRISDWSSDVCSSDLQLDQSARAAVRFRQAPTRRSWPAQCRARLSIFDRARAEQERCRSGATEPVGRWVAQHARHRLIGARSGLPRRSEEHTSELQSLMRISYAVFCLTKKYNTTLICQNSQH